MLPIISMVLSAIAIIVSAFTAWATLFRRGALKMTQPTVIFFGPDGSRNFEDLPPPKVYLRTLLFSTGKKGRMIESMHVKVTRNETIQNFNVWVYGEENLVRGSGLFVGEEGVTANHHFLTPKDGNKFSFTAGDYQLELFAKILGEKKDRRIWSQSLIIDQTQENLLNAKSSGIYFDWGPDSKRYLSHIEAHPPRPRPEDFMNILMSSKKETAEPRE